MGVFIYCFIEVIFGFVDEKVFKTLIDFFAKLVIFPQKQYFNFLDSSELVSVEEYHYVFVVDVNFTLQLAFKLVNACVIF